MRVIVSEEKAFEILILFFFATLQKGDNKTGLQRGTPSQRTDNQGGSGSCPN